MMAALPMTSSLVLFALVIILASGALSAALTALMRPILRRYALANPNARSSHHEPTPQGGGLPVILSTIIVVLFGAYAETNFNRETGVQLLPIVTGTLLIALVGAVDDIRDLRIRVRLPLQALSVAIVISAMPHEIRVVSQLPLWFERSLLVLGCVYFVNIANFMDGIDWITVAEVVPVTAGLALVGALGALPWHGILIAVALLGATIGFAPFNRPVAKLFLGDVGSLPIGLLLGLLLAYVAASGNWAAAILLPLYYLADASITLLRRLFTGERFWQAHRSHFYQRATDGGFSVIEIDAWVFAVNLCLVALSVSTVIASSKMADFTALAIGGGLVGGLLFRFAHGKT